RLLWTRLRQGYGGQARRGPLNWRRCRLRRGSPQRRSRGADHRRRLGRPRRGLRRRCGLRDNGREDVLRAFLRFLPEMLLEHLLALLLALLLVAALLERRAHGGPALLAHLRQG